MVRKKLLAMPGVIFFLLAFSHTAPCDAQNGNPFDASIREQIAAGLNKGQGICAVVGNMIRSGKDCSDTVNNAIVMGHPACVVVRCAIEAGGKLEDVVSAAYKAGATSDIIVSCLVDEGVDTDMLARTIERLGLPGLGYTPPPVTPGYTPTFAPDIGGGGGGRGTVSPAKP